MKTKCPTVAPLCPTIFKTNNDTYIVVGKRIDHQRYDEIKDRVADDEAAVEIDAVLVEACVEESK